MRPALRLFAKWPAPGRVKTRLCPPLTPEQAADLSTAFLLDRVAGLRNESLWDWAIAGTPDECGDRFARLCPGAPVRPQGGGDLGGRMDRAVAGMLAESRPAALIVGSDAPFLTVETLRTATARLVEGTADLALVPAPDGGYSAIGLAVPCPELFHAMPWSTPRVVPETLRRAGRLGLRVHLGPTIPDCDTPEDLDGLLARFRAEPGVVGKQTGRALEALFGSE